MSENWMKFLRWSAGTAGIAGVKWHVLGYKGIIIGALLSLPLLAGFYGLDPPKGRKL